MRGDLTAAFITAKNGSFRRPRQLMVFRFPEAGDVYVSDQALGAADGLSHEYQPLVESWGELQDAAGDATAQEQSEVRQMSVTLWNGGAHPFSDYFLAEPPENVEVELYQWFAGLAESDRAFIDRFVVQDPIEFDEASRLLTLDLVSLAATLDAPCGELLTKESWPTADEGDVGRGIPLAFGEVGRIPTLQAVTPIILTLKGSVLANTTTLMIYESLADLSFPATATVKIDEELIRVSKGAFNDRLTVVQRGYLSEAAEHLDKRQIIQVITNHTFILCEGPVAGISNVQIDGYPAPAGIYTVRPDLDPARIIFSEPPWVKKYAEATRFLEMQFDGIAPGNTALQAANAFDPADAATAAVIQPGNTILALAQYTVNRNRGEIMRAYLAVEHWESGNFLHDYAEVSVSGVGVVGRLSRPNPNDKIDMDAVVDINHGHDHEIGGEHVHNFTNPAVTTTVSTRINTTNPSHTHAGTGGTGTDIVQTVSTSETTVNEWVNDIIPGWRRPQGDTLTFTVYPSSTSWKCNIWLQSSVSFNLYFDGVLYGTYGPRDWAGYAIDPAVVDGRTITVEPAQNGVQGDYCHFYKASCTNTIPQAVEPTTTSISSTATTSATSSTTTTGVVKSTGVVGVKLATDVKHSTEAPKAITINDQDNPSRTVVNLFDLTNYVNFSWAWFTGRTITVTYVNAGDGKQVHILHAFFEVEYVPTEIVYSNEVTAEVTGVAGRSRPDEVIRYLLCDKGGVADTRLDAAVWAATAAKYTARGYALGGLIDASMRLREAISKVCLQARSRLFTSGGLYKLVLREGHPATKAVSAQLTPDKLQARSIAVSRQPLAEIANKIQLFYRRDWTVDSTDASGYLDSVTRSDSGSIARFGVKMQPDRYNFDLIRSATMAASVADFYLSTDAWPSSFYTFMAYLDRFDLEKEDVLQVSAGFNQMAKTPMVVRSMDRIFGSAKNSSINLFRVVAENLYYVLKKVSMADAALIMDSLACMLTEVGEFADGIHILDDLLAQLNLNKTDAALLADTLTLVMDFRTELLDPALASDQVHAAMDCLQEDTAMIYEVPEFWSVYGFGSGGFGQVKFGGLTAWKQKHPDQIYAFMQLLVACGAKREDEAAASDRLIMNSGFGGRLSSGFGQSLFGW